MSEEWPAIQVNMLPLGAIFKVFQGEPPWGTPYYHMSRETAYERLKLYTQQDFGEDFARWEEWLEAHNYQPTLTKAMLREAKATRCRRRIVRQLSGCATAAIAPDVLSQQLPDDPGFCGNWLRLFPDVRVLFCGSSAIQLLI